jgi:delta24-sterol reductase
MGTIWSVATFATSAGNGRPRAPFLSSNKPIIPQWHRSSWIRQYSAPCNSSHPIDRHNKTVEEISEKVRGFFDRKEKFRIFHGSTNSTRSALKKNLLDTSSLSHVLEIDTGRKTCLVEPNVSMDRLVEATLKYGLVPPVVMEFPGITV